MNDPPQPLDLIQADSRYQTNIQWGSPRPGHPEGSIRNHIIQLEENLQRLAPRLTHDEADELRLLIHTHDTFKPDAAPGVPIKDPQSHASLAKSFLAEFVSDPELLAITQLHDEPYALWKKTMAGADPSERLAALKESISNWDAFMAFLIIDGCTDGKTRAPLHWFFNQIQNQVCSRVDQSWIEQVSDEADE